MLCGLPGSGKSQYAERIAAEYDFTIHASDALRKELFGDENYQDKNEELFDTLHRRIKRDLRNGKNVIYDATNISRKRRMAFLRSLGNIECHKCCVFIPTPYETCLKVNKKRGRTVPEEVIERMYKSFQVPHRSEGFDSVFVDYSVLRKNLNIHNLIKRLDKVSQDNPHHKLTIGEHCKEAVCYIAQHTKSVELRWAAYIHDIGKGFCKQFKNSYGSPTKYAHYYGHENVSAYLAVGYLRPHFSSTETILDIAFLVNNHMRLMQIERLPQEVRRTTYERFKRQVGDDRIIAQLMLLREADKYAATKH